jgi:predicted NodU family carbamoyl transferase
MSTGNNVLILGFSGIHNGEYYLKHYGLRFVGHDAAVALVRDGQILFVAEEERFSRKKHTSSFPVGALEAALRPTGLRIQDIDVVAYPWHVTARKFLHMNLNHVHRVRRCCTDRPGNHRIASHTRHDVPAIDRQTLRRGLGASLPRCRGSRIT